MQPPVSAGEPGAGGGPRAGVPGPAALVLGAEGRDRTRTPAASPRRNEIRSPRVYLGMNEQRHQPTGDRRDPIYTRPAGASSSEKATAGKFLALVAWIGGTVTAFGVGAWILGLVMAVIGLLVALVVYGVNHMD